MVPFRCYQLVHATSVKLMSAKFRYVANKVWLLTRELFISAKTSYCVIATPQKHPYKCDSFKFEMLDVKKMETRRCLARLSIIFQIKILQQ